MLNSQIKIDKKLPNTKAVRYQTQYIKSNKKSQDRCPVYMTSQHNTHMHIPNLANG